MPEKKIIATLYPQYWDAHDNAVPAGEPVTFDVTEIVTSMTTYERDQLTDNSDESDGLYYEAARRGIVSDGYGPFYVNVVDSMGEYYDTDIDERDAE